MGCDRKSQTEGVIAYQAYFDRNPQVENELKAIN